MIRPFLVVLSTLVLATAGFSQTPDSDRPLPIPLNTLVRDADTIVVLELEKCEPDKRRLTFKLVATLKGKANPSLLVHRLADLARCPDTAPLFRWARPGRKAVCISEKNSADVCLGNFWYSLKLGPDPTARGTEALPHFATTFVGSIDQLRRAVADLVAGKETTISVQAERDWFAEPPPCHLASCLRGVKGRVWRIRLQPRPPVKADDPDRLARFISDLFLDPHVIGLGAVVPDAIPQLTTALGAADPADRCEAAIDLGQLGTAGRSALPRLRQALRDGDPYVRLYAAEAILFIDADAPFAIAPFTAKEAPLLTAGILALGNLGPRARPALPMLLEQLSHPEEQVREAAAWAIGAVGLGDDTPLKSRIAVAEALGKLVASDVGLVALRSLRRLGADAWPAVPDLAASVRGNHYEWGAVAADVLMRLEPPAAHVLAQAIAAGHQQLSPELFTPFAECGGRAWLGFAALADLLPADDHQFAKASHVVRALIQIDSRRAVPLVAARLTAQVRAHKSPTPESDTALLAELVPHAVTAQAAMRQLLKHDDLSVRRVAIQTLWNSENSQEARAVLGRMLLSGDVHEPSIAVESLLELRLEARTMADTLRSVLSKTADESWAARLRLALALIAVDRGGTERLRSPRQEALSRLLTLSKNPWRSHSVHLCFELNRTVDMTLALSDLAREAEKLLPSLVEGKNVPPRLAALLDAPEAPRRLAAAVALCHLNPQHPRAPAVLLRTLEERPLLFPAAVDTLSTLGSTVPGTLPQLRRGLLIDNHAIYLAAKRQMQRLESQTIKEVWGLKRLQRGKHRLDLSASELEARWELLRGVDAAQAYRAGWELALAGDAVVTFLERRLSPVPSKGQQAIAALIVDLDSRRFESRRRAADELETLDVQAEPQLRRALATRPPLETRRRLEQLLERLEPTLSSERLRVLRAIQTLEQIDTPAARRLLQRLADGAEQATITQQARLALTRLQGSR